MTLERSGMSLEHLLLESDFERVRIEAIAERVVARLEPLLRRREPKGVDPNYSYTLEEAAQRMKVSVHHVNRLRAKKLLRWRRIGGAVRILERDIADYYRRQDERDPDDEPLRIGH